VNEASVVSGLRKQVKLAMRGCYWHKIADRATLGRPDISVTWRGRTSWPEVKFLRKTRVTDEDVLKKIGSDQVQLSTMLSAFNASEARAFYAVYVRDAQPRVEIWEPCYHSGTGLTAAKISVSIGFTHASVVQRLLQQHRDDWRQV